MSYGDYIGIIFPYSLLTTRTLNTLMAETLESSPYTGALRAATWYLPTLSPQPWLEAA